MNTESAFQAALASLRQRIDAACRPLGRDPAEPTIVAVTKGFGPEAVHQALSFGLTDIGENYLQEAQAKFEAVRWPAQARKHFIGRIQKNKARKIACLFDTVQTVDDLRTATLLASGAQECGKTLDVLLQVNAAFDQRQGLAPEKVNPLALEIAGMANLRVRGIMVLGPADRTKSDEAFSRAWHCFERLRSQLSSVTILSMGMSDDMEFALAHGSTMLRIGTALFGSRAVAR